MALHQLIYMSSLTSDDETALSEILAASVRNNQRKNLTGMILYADGNVLQVLEGEQEPLLETFQVIQADWRHRGVFVLLEEEIPVRRFSSWSMGFRQLTADDLARLPAAAHVFKARRDEIALRVRPSDALTILQSFAEGSMQLT